MKPINIVINIHIQRPRKEIFAFISHIPNHQLLFSANLSSRLTSKGPLAIGSSMTNVAKFLGMKLEEKFIFTEFIQDVCMAKESAKGSTFYTTDKMEFSDSESGGTYVTTTVYAEITGILSFFPKAVKNKIEKILQQDWQRNKKMFEEKSW